MCELIPPQPLLGTAPPFPQRELSSQLMYPHHTHMCISPGPPKDLPCSEAQTEDPRDCQGKDAFYFIELMSLHKEIQTFRVVLRFCLLFTSTSNSSKKNLKFSQFQGYEVSFQRFALRSPDERQYSSAKCHRFLMVSNILKICYF